jgi:hypothetical protein
MNFFAMFRAARKCTTKPEAEDLINATVYDLCAEREQLTYNEARKMVLDNLAYIAAYHDHADALYVYDLFEIEHPIFGRNLPTPEQAREHAKQIMGGTD